MQKLLDRQTIDEEWYEHLIEDDDLEDDLLEAAEDEIASESEQLAENPDKIDFALLRAEIAEIDAYLEVARTIREDQKSHALLHALEQGFARMVQMGAVRKAVVFTESRRTQEYLARFLEAHGHAGT